MARRTKAEAAATREALIDAAEEMFMEHGVARTSLEQIARHAGMTRGAVYWHFKNKADLFHAMLDRVHLPFQYLFDEVDSAIADSCPLEAIRQACIKGFARAELPRNKRVHFILMYRCEFFSDIDPQAMQEEISGDISQVLLKYFQLAAERQQLTTLSPEAAADLFHATLSGLFYAWLRHPERYSLEARGTIMIEDLLSLLRSG
ncbi:TetR family transcriptional regulator [Marinobacterium sediminicola]|uniref:Transcriptional regulator, TetR family n=1 Tax=Marinobacterium sediminicola TaxID=518898 RepID=A0ABY1RWC2_9GAMM|nr:TetR family transcriptional regulator [Marinobacterium sediminicola]ULG70369.1 TetR family transcriptional regulator [Marinobacterium sediminicola]SMR69591.1 transcriptional regulator, TetR family [Marinobacterium sediminicola]